MASNTPNIDPSKPSSRPAGDETRKLAAIMFTDIKDFSKKMQKNESAAMRMLKAHNQILDETVARNAGTTIKTIGDAYLVSFDSVVSATICAMEAQQAFHQHNSEAKSEEERIDVRIGVHLGDVIVKDKDVFGDGVNIASRIQSIAEVGGVNISDSVYQQVRNKINIRVLNLGVPQLKGIEQPIKVYQVIIVPTDKARGKLATNIFVLKTILKRKKTKRNLGYGFGIAAVLAFVWMYLLSPAPPSNSLAILPFQNMGDTTNEYIADGFTQDLNTYISKLGEVRVLSEGSTREFKGTKLKDIDIAEKLGVRYLLTGSIEVQGNRVKVRCRLTDPAKKSDLYVGNFDDNSREEILNNEHEIFRQVALRFQSELADSRTSKTSMDVYDLYLRGLEYDRRAHKEDNQLAISLFQQAVEKDTTFAQGYIKLASTELQQHEQNWDNSERWLVDAERNIKRALALDSSNAEVDWLLGRLSLARGDRKQGISYLQKSIDKNPNLMRSYIYLGNEYLFNLNDPARAIIYFTKAFELEPTNYASATNLGVAYGVQRNYPEAIKSFQRATALNASQEDPWINLGVLFERTFSYDSAEAAYKNALQRNPKDPVAAEYLAALHVIRGHPGEAESVLNSCLRYEPNNYSLLYTLGVAKFQRGQKDTATMVWKDGARLAEAATLANPNVSQNYLYVAFFSARLGLVDSAIAHGKRAVVIDSSYDNVMGMARIYSILGQKGEMIDWFRRARAMDPEYDASFLATDIDFERYRSDPDLLIAARQ
ncbi:MAG: adenylate/guanylate cyclase domain-containing protein [Bacteroidota bacterium]|jgi:adenylate cyclase